MRFHLYRAATVAECTPRTRKDDQLVRPSPAQLLIYAKLPARRLWVQANYCAIRGMLAQEDQHVPDCQVRSSLLRPINAVGGHIQERRSAHAEYLKTACVHRRTIRSAENSTWPSLSLSQNGYGDGARMKSSTLSWASRNGFRLQPLAPTIPNNSSNSSSLASRVCSFSFAVILGRTTLFLNHCNAR